MQNLTKKQFIQMLEKYEDDMEIGFYLEGFGDFKLKDISPATNLETNKPAISIEFKA